MFRLAGVLGAVLLLPSVAMAAPDPGVAWMETLLAKTYEAAQARAPNDAAKSKLSEEQKRWLAARHGACPGGDADCLIRVDQQRVAVLQYDKMAAAWPKLPFRPALVQGADTPICKAIYRDLLAAFYGSTLWIDPLGEREIEFAPMPGLTEATDYQVANFDPYNSGKPIPMLRMLGENGAEHFGMSYYNVATPSAIAEIVERHKKDPHETFGALGDPYIDTDKAEVYADNPRPEPVPKFVTEQQVVTPDLPRFFRFEGHVYLYNPGLYNDENGGVYDLTSATEIDQICLLKTYVNYRQDTKNYEAIDKAASFRLLDDLAAPLLPHGQVCESAGDDSYTRSVRGGFRPWALEAWPNAPLSQGAENFDRFMRNRGLAGPERYRQWIAYEKARAHAIEAVMKYYATAFGRDDAETRRLATAWVDQERYDEGRRDPNDPTDDLYAADFADKHRADAAALMGDLNGLRAALGADPKATAARPLGPHDEPLTTDALEHLEILRALLSMGLDTDRFGASGRTALMVAARLDLKDSAALLLDRGAKPNLGAADAVATPYSEGDVLCQKEGKAPAGDIPGRTALSYAAEMGSPALVKLLLDRGADRAAADKDGHAPAFWAARRGEPARAEILGLLNPKK